MKIGFNMPQLGPHADRRAVRRFILDAEAAGFDSLWVQEHLMVPESPRTGYAGRPGVPMPDEYRSFLAPLELLAYAAAISERLTLGTSILVAAYHRPIDLAKRLATLDLLSDGRVVCGLGLGWSEDEYIQMGAPFSKRGARMTDFIRALRACWQPDPIAYDGPFFTIPRCDSSPKPVQRTADGAPGVPIILGLGSEQGIRRTAELADGWHPAGLPAAMATAARSRIDELARAAGRSAPLPTYLRVFAIPSLGEVPDLDRRAFGPISWTGPIERMAEKTAEARDAGIEHLVIDTSFSGEVRSPESWIEQVRYFAPLAGVAHG